MANNVQILEKPLILKPGESGFFRVKNRLLIIEIVSDDGVNVAYKYPLKADDEVHTVPKHEVFLPLDAVGSYFKYA